MAKQKKIRFAVGTIGEPFSGIWRVAYHKNDVYVGVSKTGMGLFKVSLHQSGVWTLAFTEQSGASMNGNRRAKQWRRPSPHAPGIVRGPSIVVPHTSLGARRLPPDETTANVLWLASPGPGYMIEYSLYFVNREAKTDWDPAQIELATFSLSSGARVVLFAATHQVPDTLSATIEQLLAENVFQADALEQVGGSFLWFTESRDHLKIPVVFDLPIPLARRDPGWAAQDPDS